MRAFVGIVLVLLLCGCSAAGLMKLGAGKNVYSEDIARESALQEAYSGILCRDNGLPYVAAESGGRCDYSRMNEGHWRVFVNAGLYDIDRRCDGYLEWLYEMKQLREPISNQLGRTAAAAGTLLRLFDVADLTIEVVALAFNYTQETFTNFDANLIFGVESSTIQTLVLNRQRNAKDEIVRLRFSSKPEAMHALRGYLRICMPFTIETDINTTLSAGARGRIYDPVVEVSATTTGALEASRQVRIDDQPPGPGPSEAAKAMFLNAEGKGDEDVRQVQSYLCVKPDAVVGKDTEVAIYIVEDNPGVKGYEVDGKLSTVEYAHALGFGEECPTALYKNSYERQFLSDPDDYAGIVEDINKLLPDNPLPLGPYDGSVQDQLRVKLRALRTNTSITVSSIVPDDQLSRSFRNAIRKLAR